VTDKASIHIVGLKIWEVGVLNVTLCFFMIKGASKDAYGSRGLDGESQRYSDAESDQRIAATTHGRECYF
jgi:hypothetical protein